MTQTTPTPEATLRELERAIKRTRRLQPPPPVPFEPAPGRSTQEWLDEVSAVRALHDQWAVEHRRATDDASRELFGASAAELLAHDGPMREVTLTHESVAPLDLDEVRDVVPQLALAPRPLLARAEVPVAILSPDVDPVMVVVRLHGGAFWMGGGATSLALEEHALRYLARTCRAVVVDVDYALAPEHPYPQSLLDTLGVLREMARRHPGLPVALWGISSGGNVAMMVARLLADEGRGIVPALGALVLGVSAMQLDPPGHDDTLDPAVSRTALLRSYFGQLPSAGPWASPAVAEELPGLPPTWIIIGTHDDVASGGPEVGRAVQRAGGSAECRGYPMNHTVAPPAVEVAVAQDLAGFLTQTLCMAPAPPAPRR